MKTAITELLGIEHPLVCPGMTHVANAELVAATCNAGGLGILAIGHLTPEQTRAEILKVRALTNRPFAIGCALIMPGSRENLDVALDLKVPIVNFSLGHGKDISERVHAYGGKTIATVVSAKHALSAEKAGVDALLVTGHEAAAHGGSVTTLVLVPAVREVTRLPMIAAGGFSTGAGLVAALALGADAVAMGTRWAATQESPVHANTKALIVEKEVEDTLYNRNFDSMPCRVMKTPNAQKVMSRKLSPLRAIWQAWRAARVSGRPVLSILRQVVSLGLTDAIKVLFFGAAVRQIEQATLEGNHQQGIQLIGQTQGLVHDVPTVAELTERILREAGQAQGRVHGLEVDTPSVKVA